MQPANMANNNNNMHYEPDSDLEYGSPSCSDSDGAMVQPNYQRKNDDSSKRRTLAIVGGLVALLVAAGIIGGLVVLIYCCCCKKSKNNSSTSTTTSTSSSSSTVSGPIATTCPANSKLHFLNTNTAAKLKNAVAQLKSMNSDDCGNNFDVNAILAQAQQAVNKRNGEGVVHVGAHCLLRLDLDTEDDNRRKDMGCDGGKMWIYENRHSTDYEDNYVMMTSW